MAHPQPHALAALEISIAEAERVRDRRRLMVDRFSGADVRRAQIVLRSVEEHLAELYRQRTALLKASNLPET